MATPGLLLFLYDLYKKITFLITCMLFSELENHTLNQAELNEIILMNTMDYSRSLDKMKIRDGEPFSGLKSIFKNV